MYAAMTFSGHSFYQFYIVPGGLRNNEESRRAEKIDEDQRSFSRLYLVARVGK